MTYLALLADIGGTNARFALADLSATETPFPRDISSSPSASFPSLAAAAAAYLKKTGAKPVAAVVALAGPVAGETAFITNLNWSVSKDELRNTTGAQSILLVNDFEALALSVPLLKNVDLLQIGGGSPVERAAKAVVGPGTGLGVGGVIWAGGRWMPIPGEGGHTSFAAESADEFAVMEFLRAGRDHLSNERVISGPGLVNLYAAMVASQGGSGKLDDAQEVTHRALSGEDPAAVAALDFFMTALGRVAGDTALTLGARGGVYLGGGIPPKIRDALAAGNFRKAFESKGRLSSFLQPVPVYVILAGDATLRGGGVALSAFLAAEPR